MKHESVVYFILCQDKVKIGVTINVRSRFSHLQCSSPEKLTLLKYVKGDCGVEAIIHRLFAEQHVRGEWYQYDEDLADFIESLDDKHSLFELLHRKERMRNLAVVSEFKRTKAWPDPTQQMLKDPEFEAIWQVIRDWDIHVPGAYEGYCGATGNHVRVILEAIRKTRKKD